MVLLAIAAVPVIGLAAVLAWQTYVLQRDEPLQTARLAREGVSASHFAALDGVKQSLDGLASDTAMRGAFTQEAGACNSAAEAALLRGGGRYVAILVADRQGAIRCATSLPGLPTQIGDTRAFQAMRSTGAPVIAPVATDALGPDRSVLVGVPLAGPSGFGGAIVAAVSVDWLRRVTAPPQRATGVAVWLFDTSAPDGAGPADPAMPSDKLLSGLAADERGVVSGRSQGGRLYAYASQRLADGLLLVAGVPAGDVIAQARDDLIRRFAALTVLLGIGFAAIALGANRAVVNPVKNLTAAVRHWRDGETFSPETTFDTPTEVTDLSHAFEEATQRLAEREAQLRAAVEQRDLVMQEIHHRVKNNLQVVASLLNLQSGRIRSPSARAEFQSARDRVRALATLHRHLYLHGDVQRINMRGFLLELCEQLLPAMSDRDADRLTLDVDAPELVMNSDQAVPLSLIVTEAVSNSVKYAFPDGRSGRIAVRLSADDTTVHLQIEDDGVGITPGVVQTEAGPRDGLGIQLIHGFARQLDGTLTVHQDRGTCYKLSFPRHRVDPAPPPVPGSDVDVVQQAH